MCGSPSPRRQQKIPILGHSVYGQGEEKVMVFHDWMGDVSATMLTGTTPRGGFGILYKFG